MCTHSPESDKPVIYVNNANALFNISGIYTFTNLKFTGVNAYAQLDSLDLSIIPA